MIYDGFTDFAMSYDGDLIVKDGDIAYISGIDWLKREINKILRTTNPEWAGNPTAGADLCNFIGAPNTRETATDIKETITRALDRQGLIVEGEVDVRVVPVSLYNVQILIHLIADGERTQIADMVFEYNGAGVRTNTYDPIAVNAKDLNYDSMHNKNKNKYLERLDVV